MLSTQSSDSTLLLVYLQKIFSFHFQDQNVLVKLINRCTFWLISEKKLCLSFVFSSSDIINNHRFNSYWKPYTQVKLRC